LPEKINFVSLQTPGVETELLIIKGSRETLIDEYLKKIDRNNEDPYIREVISAIQRNDKERIKTLVGDLSIPEDLVRRTETWDGRIDVLTITSSVNFDGEFNKTTSKTTRSINFEDYQFILARKDGRVVLKEIATPKTIALE
jgi:transaldolase